MVSVILAREATIARLSRPARLSVDHGPALTKIGAEIDEERAMFEANEMRLAEWNTATRLLSASAPTSRGRPPERPPPWPGR